MLRAHPAAPLPALPATSTPGFDGLWIGAALLFFIYTGFGALGAAAEEVRVRLLLQSRGRARRAASSAGFWGPVC